MELSKIMRYVAMAVVSVLFFLVGWLITQHQSSTGFQVVGMATALFGLFHWKLWPAYVPPSTCRIRHSTTETMQDPCGLTLEPGRNMYMTFEEMVQTYKETLECVGLGTDIPGPSVRFMSFSEANLTGAWGYYASVGEIVMVDTDEHTGLNRDCLSDRQTLRHEFIHHILHKSGFDDESMRHVHSAFPKCGPGVENRG